MEIVEKLGRSFPTITNKSTFLEDVPEIKAVTRESCTGCYHKLVKKESRDFAIAGIGKVSTRCNPCHKRLCSMLHQASSNMFIPIVYVFARQDIFN